MAISDDLSEKIGIPCTRRPDGRNLRLNAAGAADPSGLAVLRLTHRWRCMSSPICSRSTRGSSGSNEARPAHGSLRSCGKVSPSRASPPEGGHQQATASSSSLETADGRVDELSVYTFATKTDG